MANSKHERCCDGYGPLREVKAAIRAQGHQALRATELGALRRMASAADRIRGTWANAPEGPYSVDWIGGGALPASVWLARASRLSFRCAWERLGTRHKYKWRHLIENFFCSIKAFRRIATRYEKTDSCFTAIINLVAVVLWTR